MAMILFLSTKATMPALFIGHFINCLSVSLLISNFFINLGCVLTEAIKRKAVGRDLYDKTHITHHTRTRKQQHTNNC
jgi:hypothetical protein